MNWKNQPDWIIKQKEFIEHHFNGCTIVSFNETSHDSRHYLFVISHDAELKFITSHGGHLMLSVLPEELKRINSNKQRIVDDIHKVKRAGYLIREGYGITLYLGKLTFDVKYEDMKNLTLYSSLYENYRVEYEILMNTFNT